MNFSPRGRRNQRAGPQRRNTFDSVDVLWSLPFWDLARSMEARHLHAVQVAASGVTFPVHPASRLRGRFARR